MKKFLLAVVAVALTACSTTIADYRSLASKVVPTNVELFGTVSNPWSGESKVVTYCSGVVVSPTRIITAGHCTEAAKKSNVLKDGKVQVRLSDGREVLADILVSEDVDAQTVDANKDIALLEVKEGGLTRIAELGDSDSVAVGDQVAVVGNSFGELTFSFSVGVVSALRAFPDAGAFIQTTAMAAPGNSGGPVFDMNGKLVGILTRGFTPGGGANLFIPINVVIRDIAEALKHGQQERAHGGKAAN